MPIQRVDVADSGNVFDYGPRDVATWVGIFSFFVPMLGLVAMYLGALHHSRAARVLGKISMFLWLVACIMLCLQWFFVRADPSASYESEETAAMYVIAAGVFIALPFAILAFSKRFPYRGRQEPCGICKGPMSHRSYFVTVDDTEFRVCPECRENVAQHISRRAVAELLGE
jgi:hypothetical protein